MMKILVSMFRDFKKNQAIQEYPILARQEDHYNRMKVKITYLNYTITEKLKMSSLLADKKINTK